jgi:hypothetical protein
VGSTAVVGTPYDDEQRGTVHVFVRSGTTWTERQTLTNGSGGMGDDFGYAIGFDGTTLVAAAPGRQLGQAIVFTRSNGAWTRRAVLSPDHRGKGELFGSDVGVRGSTVIVGAPCYRPEPLRVGGGERRTGSVYVFENAGGTWSELAQLTPRDGHAGDAFGQAVEMSDTVAVATAPVNRGFRGAAYVLTSTGGAWSVTDKIVDPNARPLDDFGISIALVGTTALIGEVNGGPAFAGQAFVVTGL